MHTEKKMQYAMTFFSFFFECIPWMAAKHYMVAFHDMLIASVPGVLRDAPADMRTHESVVDTQFRAPVFRDFHFYKNCVIFRQSLLLLLVIVRFALY